MRHLGLTSDSDSPREILTSEGCVTYRAAGGAAPSRRVTGQKVK